MCMNKMQEIITWCSSNNDLTEEEEAAARNLIKSTSKDPSTGTGTGSIIDTIYSDAGGDCGGVRSITCPSCGHYIELYDQARINNLLGLPKGVKFDPTDQEILEHLEAKVAGDVRKIHPLIDEFIPTLDGENGICSTHPENLPGVHKDGQMRHFFHRPSKAYTTGTRKRRKVHTDGSDGSETRWHKTGKTRPIIVSGSIKGFKKILVLYTNYGRQRKPEKTNWIMHQYHRGNNEEERDGELVLSKVFYQTQPRQCGTSSSSNIITTKDCSPNGEIIIHELNNSQQEDDSDFDHHQLVEYFNNPAVNFVSYRASQQQPVPNIAVQGDDGSRLIPFTVGAPQRKIAPKS